MCLRELLDMARASQEGALLENVLSRLRREGQAFVAGPHTIVTDRFQFVAKQVRDALTVMPDRPDQFLPGGRSYATVAAALDHLTRDANLIEVLVEVLDKSARDAKDWRQLSELDPVIMLLDDELAYEGHSRAWRERVAADVASGIAAGADLAEAINAALEREGSGWPHDIQWLFPIARIEERREPVLSNKLYETEMAQEVLNGWPDLPDGEINIDNGAFVILLQECSDLEAGLERAEDWLDRQVGLWRLQGGDVTVDREVLYHDQSSRSVGRIERPTPLMLLPANLVRLDAVLVDEQPMTPDDGLFLNPLPDAIVQLSQARSSARGAALSDLWTVAEAVFAGHAAEVSAEAVSVIAEVAQHLYPASLLEWLAEQFDGLTIGGVMRDASLSAQASALEVISKHGPDLFKVLDSDDTLALVYVRAKSFAAWGDSSQLQAELTELGDRMRRVADRAYLVRNFVVHAAQPQRARALAVTLPVFAELLTACLGFVAAEAGADQDPIVAAKLAVMRIHGLAELYAREKPAKTAADLLREHLQI